MSMSLGRRLEVAKLCPGSLPERPSWPVCSPQGRPQPALGPAAARMCRVHGESALTPRVLLVIVPAQPVTGPRP